MLLNILACLTPFTVKRFKGSILLIQHYSQPQLLLTKKSLITAGVASALSKTNRKLNLQARPHLNNAYIQRDKGKDAREQTKPRWLCLVTLPDNDIDFC